MGISRPYFTSKYPARCDFEAIFASFSPRRHSPNGTKMLNFGDGTWKGGKADIDTHIDRLVVEGRKADALMIHGVGKETGAHRPFKDAAHFERFLQALKAREEAGDVKVVPYMEIAEDVAPDNNGIHCYPDKKDVRPQVSINYDED